MAFVVAIGGATASGKTTLAASLKSTFVESHHVTLLSLDDFYTSGPFEKVEGGFENWDIPESFRLDDLSKEIEKARTKEESGKPGLVIVEGILLFCNPDMMKQYDSVIYLNTDLERIKTRRFQRDKWIQGNKDYFELAVIPAHLKHGTLQHLPARPTPCIVDAALSKEEVLELATKHIVEEINKPSKDVNKK